MLACIFGAWVNVGSANVALDLELTDALEWDTSSLFGLFSSLALRAAKTLFWRPAFSARCCAPRRLALAESLQGKYQNTCLCFRNEYKICTDMSFSPIKIFKLIFSFIVFDKNKMTLV